jgi:AraC-like DNA-binding protein
LEPELGKKFESFEIEIYKVSPGDIITVPYKFDRIALGYCTTNATVDVFGSHVQVYENQIGLTLVKGEFTTPIKFVKTEAETRVVAFRIDIIYLYTLLNQFIEHPPIPEKQQKTAEHYFEGGHSILLDTTISTMVHTILEQIRGSLSEFKKNHLHRFLKLKLEELILVLTQLDWWYSVIGLSPLSQGKSKHEILNWLVDENLNYTWSMDEMKSISDLSTQSINNYFKETYGESPGKYIQNKRIEFAKRLLNGREKLPLSKIAELIGIKDPAYFQRFFKRQTGMTPGDFRKFTSS